MISVLAAGTLSSEMVGGSAWRAGPDGFEKYLTNSEQGLRQSGGVSPLPGKTYAINLTIGGISSGQLRSQLVGGTTQSGRACGFAGLHYDEIVAVSGTDGSALQPSTNTVLANGVRMSARAISYKGDVFPKS